MHKMILDNSDTPQLIKEIHQLLLKSQQARQPRQPPAVPLAYSDGHQGGLDTGGSWAVSIGGVTDKSHGEPENEFKARISSVNRQRVLAANCTLLPEYPRLLPDTRYTPVSPPYRTPQTTLSTSPTLWLYTFESTLTAYLSSPIISLNAKRSRQTDILKTLSTLNTYLSSILDKASRRNLRRQLEEGSALAQVFEKAQGVLGGSVVLRKLIKTYEDDKAEDENRVL